MSLVLPTLLCLGLCLRQSTQEQKGSLPPPHITALPGSMVGSKNPVTILCRGPAEAEVYMITKVGIPEPSDREKQLMSKMTNSFSITDMTPDRAGLYHCSYQSGGSWSQFSDPLPLVMTVSFTQPGTYRCYGVFSRYPHGWSHPSDRLQLQVRAPLAEASDDPDPTNPEPSPEPAAWYPSAENQVRLSLAGLILLVLGMLLAEAWYSRNMPFNGDRQPPGAQYI
ncbi:leukocyte immunoglobulin-like receptor subfamily A member 6 isoform X3 [Equus quagga]|uniref:leukocyte immunoglobulin-like receptor subfamily A member 6 isoform X3 n=1 Tax=Equus quagga TaxID=89248 RepID=UPI001EE347C2|nr:leukocyte immunoglobulin-like receptor subfamily A member 6 isoform X3 [Equus quagga]XP_046506386.1 leukocyte immunoglobulin-like receptor subfamily A member 6 isoform X3 [Equus quagga]